MKKQTRHVPTTPYRTTRAAQQIAKRVLRVYGPDGQTTTLRPVTDALSPRTLATLDAIEQERTR